MPDLARTRSNLHAELESAATGVHFGESVSPAEPAVSPPESAEEAKPEADAEPGAKPELAAEVEAAVRPGVEPVPALAVSAGEVAEPLPLWRDRQAWFSGLGSFSVHLAAMVILALMAIALQEDGVKAVNARLGEEEIAALDVKVAPPEIPKFEIDAAPSFNLDTVQMDEVTSADLEREFSADQFAPPAAAGAGNGDGLMFQNPGVGRAVTKGSFAVWTEPNDPAPREDYLIIIEIAVPKKVKRFPGSDLNIEVRGTDTYYLSIPGTRTPPWLRGDLPIVDGKVQVPIRIPGGAANVRDSINVRSIRILRERQRLEIKF